QINKLRRGKMNFKSKLGIFGLTVAIAVFILMGFTQKEESYNTDEILGSLSNEYAIQAIQISGDTHPTISIDAYESKDISAIKKRNKRERNQKITKKRKN